jgi:hypothetical protein
VAGGGTVRVAYSRAGRALLIATTARGHHARRARPGSTLRALRRSFPFSRAALRGVRRAGKSSSVVAGVRGRRVSYLAAAHRSLLRRPRTLRAYLRLAGLR